MATYAHERITLADCANAACLSERTLNYGFHESFGKSPMAYLKQLRLHRAYHRLSQGALFENSVTSIATDAGFQHMGQFALDYKACFGESPSETLRNSHTLVLVAGETVDATKPSVRASELG
jgi:transcriptional regulator GlxA family with amidase domain